MGILGDVWFKESEDWVFGGVESSTAPLQPRAVAPKDEYLSVFLKSLRVKHVRKGLSKFFGAVHSFVSIPHLAQGRAEFHVVTTPKNLQNVEADGIDNVIVLNKRLMGPTPYRGGDVEIELGLFSVKSGDYAGPFLQTLEALSDASGISFVGAAEPWIGVLKSGVKLLTGVSGGSGLEVGIAATLQSPQSGYYVVMRAQKGTVDLANYQLDRDGRLAGRDGSPIRDYPYLVFSIEASDRRLDWFTIPELKKVHDMLKTSTESGNVLDTNVAFANFRRTVLLSPDLLRQDAQKLVQEVDDEVKVVLGPAQTSAGERPLMRELSQIPLYD
jgi:hypothetical protein